jgi:DNA-binding MarR family transcriptional regulator
MRLIVDSNDGNAGNIMHALSVCFLKNMKDEKKLVKKKWTFLSNHGRIISYINAHPQDTVQSMANKAGLSIRAVQTILNDLEEEGYLIREKIGRNNNYRVNLYKPLRHHLERRRLLGEILGCKRAALMTDKKSI